MILIVPVRPLPSTGFSIVVKPRTSSSLVRVPFILFSPVSHSLGSEAVRHTAPRRMRGPSYPTLEAQTSRKDKATPPSGPGVGTIGHQPLPGKLRPLTKNLRIGTHLIIPYTSRLSIRPVPVCRIYERRPSGTLCKWKQINRSTVHKVTDTQSRLTRKCH